MTWRWEYDPDEAYVIGGAPPAFVAEVEKKADALVRAASAFYSTAPATASRIQREAPRMFPVASSTTRSFRGTSASTCSR